MSDPTVVVSFKDTPHSERVREAVEARCAHLAREFPETTRFEVTLSSDALGFSAHGHVTGRSTEVAGHATGQHLGEAAERMLAKVERALRKVHDKKIFNSRREARKTESKRHG
jgi:ribosome-associated translation inhibitor RaiA